jgi:methylmalonyl-CoA carboxyltransferase small subunit
VKLKLTIDGQVYEVEVEADEAEPVRTPRALPIAGERPRTDRLQPTAPIGAAGDSVADESKVCRSPVAGVVVKVSVQAAQAIQAHDVLLVLEAMKMETSITSPVSGKVSRVNAAVGDPVQGGQVLVEFE